MADASQTGDAPSGKPAKTAPVPFPQTIGEAWRQFTGNGACAHPAVQFAKYGFVGALSTLVNLLAAFVFARWVFPCITTDDPIVKLFGLDIPEFTGTDATRALLYAFSWVCAFVVSNTFCYVLNRRFVFVPGKLKPVAEYLSFMAVGALAMGVGLVLSWALIRFLGTQTSIGAIVNVFTSLLINYALRKFVIFKG